MQQMNMLIIIVEMCVDEYSMISGIKNSEDVGLSDVNDEISG